MAGLASSLVHLPLTIVVLTWDMTVARLGYANDHTIGRMSISKLCYMVQGSRGRYARITVLNLLASLTAGAGSRFPLKEQPGGAYSH